MDALVGQEAKANFALWLVCCQDGADDGGREDGRDLGGAGAGGDLGGRGECEGLSWGLRGFATAQIIAGSSEAEGNGGKLATPDAR